MRTTSTGISRSPSRLIQLVAFLAALSAAGVLSTSAAQAEIILLSEAIRLSDAYEDGLPQASPTEPILGTAGGMSDGVASVETPSGGLPFDRAAYRVPSRIGLGARMHGSEERPRWSRGEKALLWSFASLNAIDAYQTMNAPGHVREANPLLGSWAGDHPSPLETLAFKGAATYGLYKLATRIEKRRTRRLALLLVNFVELSVVAHNEETTGGILF